MTGFLDGGLLVVCFLVVALMMRPSSSERRRSRNDRGRGTADRPKSGSWQA